MEMLLVPDGLSIIFFFFVVVNVLQSIFGIVYVLYFTTCSIGLTCVIVNVRVIISGSNHK